MTQAHGKSARLLLGGFNFSQYITGFTLNTSVDLAEAATLGDSAKEFFPGLYEGDVGIEGFFDSVADGPDEEIFAILAAASGTVCTGGPGGTAIGDPAHLFSVRLTTYPISVPLNDMVKFSSTLKADGAINGGRWSHALGAETATASSASVDGVASSTTGGRSHLHVTAITAGSLVVRDQDSADNSTFATINTNTSATAITSERRTISGTIRRYTRSDWTIVTGPTTFASALART